MSASHLRGPRRTVLAAFAVAAGLALAGRGGAGDLERFSEALEAVIRRMRAGS